MNSHPLISTIYLYFFAFIGLILLIISSVKFINMGLKVFVFTKAELPEKIQSKYYFSRPLSVPVPVLEKYQEEKKKNSPEKSLRRLQKMAGRETEKNKKENQK